MTFPGKKRLGGTGLLVLAVASLSLFRSDAGTGPAVSHQRGLMAILCSCPIFNCANH